VTTPLVNLQNVDVALNGKLILHGVSWELLPAQHWIIAGANGSGKSTFLRLVRGEIAPVPGGGRRVYALDGSEQTTAVGVQEAIPCVSPELQQRYLQQDWALTVRQVIESGFHGGDYSYQRLTAAQKRRARTLARRMAVEDLFRRNVQELSTGELRRVLIARALACNPRALVCDEICDGVDATGRARLLETLNRVAQAGTQLLFVTHRAEEWIPALTHRLVIQQGRIVECGKFERPHSSSGAPPAPVQGKVLRTAALRRRQTGRLPHVLIGIRHASVFLGSRRVLCDINWEMRAGEHWAILGPNGSGKSTFLKLVLGDLHPAWGGQVKRFEFTPQNTIWQVKRRLGYVSPELQANYREEIMGADVIGSGFSSSIGRTRPLSLSQKRRVARIIERYGLETIAGKRALELSYGEFRKLLLVRALVHEPELLILDEPFDGLDALSRAAMSATLAEVASHGVSLLLVSHHGGDLPACTTHLAFLSHGRLKSRTDARK